MKSIIPILFITTAPCLVMISCARPGNGGGRLSQTLSSESDSAPNTTSAAAGRTVFLKNCAHCHAADARGDEGPDLHNLNWTDEQVAARIRKGKKGQMTAFAGKLSSRQINDVVSYLRTLK